LGLGYEVVEPIISAKGSPTEEDLKNAKKLAKKIVSKVLSVVSQHTNN